MIKEKITQDHRLFIKRIVKREKQKNPETSQIINVAYTEWSEVPEVSLGSVNKPNKEIVEFVFEPIRNNDNPEFLKWFRGFQ